MEVPICGPAVFEPGLASDDEAIVACPQRGQHSYIDKIFLQYTGELVQYGLPAQKWAIHTQWQLHSVCKCTSMGSHLAAQTAQAFSLCAGQCVKSPHCHTKKAPAVPWHPAGEATICCWQTAD